MGAWLRRRKAKRQRRQKYRDQLQEEKDAAWYTAKRAKLSKKQAKKLNKIYGDLSPDDINAINQVNPYVADMAQQLEENGTPANNPDDPIEVTTAYQTEVMGEEAPEGYEAAYNGRANFDDFDREKAKGAIKTVFGAIAGAFTARKAIADQKALKGQPMSEADKAIMNVNAVRDDIVKDEKKKAFGDTVKKFTPFALLALLLYVVFKN